MSRFIQQAARDTSTPTTSGLDVSGVGVIRNGRRILSDACLSVPRGAYACILGASGSGKSTLLDAIAGTVVPAQGCIRISDRTVFDRRAGVCEPPERRRLGMVFQDYALWPHLTVIDNVALPLMARGERRASAHSAARAWLARVGLRDLAGQPPTALSGGQQQRVALVRALAVEPELILLDEPLSALDTATRLELRDFLKHLSRELGFTALHVTHDPREALALGTYLAVLADGQVIQQGTPEHIYRCPTSPVVVTLTGSGSLVPIQVLDRIGKQVKLRLGEKCISVPADPTLVPGEDALLALQPHAISCLPLAGAPIFRARRLDAQYQGDRWHVEAELAGGIRVNLWSSVNPPPDFDTYLATDQSWAMPVRKKSSV